MAFLDDEYLSPISLETRLFVATIGETISGHGDELTGKCVMRAGWPSMSNSAKPLL
ncbi:MAG: hypothetical protein ACREE4_07270 [Stellaceae bacterium]